MRATASTIPGTRSPPTPDDEIYITEQTTPALPTVPEARHPRLVGSEYIVSSTPKGTNNVSGIRCEDLITSLTFPDERFDYLLSFECLEHIPDYKSALRECARVLKSGGKFFCTVPFHGDAKHTIRARVDADGSIEHLLPPGEYHGDPVNPDGVLCFRYFGVELLDDLKDAGFADLAVWLYWSMRISDIRERIAWSSWPPSGENSSEVAVDYFSAMNWSMSQSPDTKHNSRDHIE